MIDRNIVINEIKNTQGKIFSVIFKKKDNTDRKMIARTGVTKYLRGGKSNVDLNQYIIVYDLQNKGYRTINVDTVKQMKINKRVING